MLGLSPVPAPNTWLDKLARVYLVGRDYLTSFEAARGRAFDRDQWISVLLAKYPAEEYLCELAALNHASNYEELTAAYLERYLDAVADDVAEAIRRAMAGGSDGQRRWFLARQVVLRAIRSWCRPFPLSALARRWPPTWTASAARAPPCCWSTWPPTR